MVLKVPKVLRVPHPLMALVLLTGCASDSCKRCEAQTTGPAVLTATIAATCDRCAWDIEGREAVMLRVLLDGRYSSHLPLVRTGRGRVQRARWLR